MSFSKNLKETTVGNGKSKARNSWSHAGFHETQFELDAPAFVIAPPHGPLRRDFGNKLDGPKKWVWSKRCFKTKSESDRQSQ